jgi:SAM-dependent methyltransferase
MGIEQKSQEAVSQYYDQDYFSWQKNIGAFGGWANSNKFFETVKKSDVVLDFGCGGGFLLNNLECAGKVGIEPNTSAAETIRNNGVRHFLSVAEALAVLGESSVDVIISNHALEHTLNPLQELKDLRLLLKVGGTIHFFVPCDSVTYRYNPTDINYHLFSWSPQNFGNLFTEAGFEVQYAKAYIHKWPPLYRIFARLGRPVFNLVCRLYARVERSWFQVEVKAKKVAA